MPENGNHDGGELGRNRANYAALSPLGFLARAAQVYPDHPAVMHGELRQSWASNRPVSTRKMMPFHFIPKNVIRRWLWMRAGLLPISMAPPSSPRHLKQDVTRSIPDMDFSARMRPSPGPPRKPV